MTIPLIQHLNYANFKLWVISMKNNSKRSCAVVLTFIILFSCVISPSFVCSADDAEGSVETAKPSIGIELNEDIAIFDDYIASHADAQYPNTEIIIETDSTVITQGETVKFPIEVIESGLYALEIEYCVQSETSQIPSVSIMLNGSVPYYEAYTVALNQTYVDDLEFARDEDGDLTADYIPAQIFQKRSHKEFLYDTSGYYGQMLYFYLDETVTTLELSGQIGKIALNGAAFKQYDRPESYKTTKNGKGKDYKGEALYFEAENVEYKSSSAIYPINDSSSPGVSPTSPKKKYLNSIGGGYWEDPGEYLEWKFEVLQDGYYNLTFKYRQNDVVGMSSTRRILIDGKVPYSELEEYSFNYTPIYLNETLNSNGENIKIFLTKGEHTLKMQIVLGDLSEILSKINLAMTELSNDYRKVVMITGSNVDTLRDYNLEQSIPEVIESFKDKAELLKGFADRLEKIMGGSSLGTKNLTTIAQQLKECSEDGYYITKNLASIKSNISSVNSWLVDAKSQPLKLDYFVLSAPNGEVKKPEAGFWKTVKYHVTSFLFTFSSDYDQNAVANPDDLNEITIWTSGNSTSYNILKQQIEKDFMSKYPNIKVNLRLSPGDFNTAVLSGKGPDAAIGDVMTLAFRNRVLDLTKFEDSEEVFKRFRPSALVPISFGDAVYALPTTQGMNLTYYRTDILEELDLEVPKTWDDVTQVMATLQKNNLEMGVNGFFDDILYQHGGSYYNDELTECTLDSSEAIEAFTQYCSYFTEYGAPISYDQLNRFRTGEMPIIFAGFEFSTTLLNLATEISGRWAVSEIPCTQREDGTYDHSTVSSSTGWFILNEKKKEAAWKFIKWITDADTIVENTKLNVAALDETVRTCPANIEAFYRVGWPEEMLELAKVHEDGRLVTVPAVPGSYMMTRNYGFAFSNVLYQSEVPADALKSSIKAINAEITRKRKEFGLDK